MPTRDCHCPAYDTRHRTGHGLCKRDQPEPAAWQGSRVINPNTSQQRIVHPGVNAAGHAERELVEQAHLVADDPYDDAPMTPYVHVEPNYIAAVAPDPETDALAGCVVMLDALDPDARRRVVGYLAVRYGSRDWSL